MNIKQRLCVVTMLVLTSCFTTATIAQCVPAPLDDRAIYDAVTIAAIRGATPWPDEADGIARALTSLRKRMLTWTAAYTPTEWFADDVGFYEAIVASALSGAMTNDAKWPLPASDSLLLHKIGKDAVRARRAAFAQVCR